VTAPIRLTFWGAAGQVTGSMHLLEAAGARVLLDAGLFQGHRVDARKLNAELPFDARRVDTVLVSHAHIDHTGRLPLLANQGFHGPIVVTPATRDLCAVMLADSAHIQEKDFEYLEKRGRAGPEARPLYTMADAVRVQKLMIAVPYHRVHHVRKNLSLEYLDAGHIRGSAAIDLRIAEGGPHRLVFSGDIGRNGLPIIRDPEPPSGPIDTLIIESTYATRDHESVAGSEERLGEAIRRTAARGGKVLVPSFAVGRVQELVYSINQLFRDGKIPRIPVYVDSPLAVDVTSDFRLHPETFDRSELLVESGAALFDVPLLHYVRDVADSKALNRLAGPAVIIAASGMAEAGRIVHHLANGVSDPRNTVLIVGFQAEHTLGRRIVERQPMLRLLGDEQPLRAEVVVLNGYSAHADRTELARWLGEVRRTSPTLGTVYLVHGEASAQDALREQLSSDGYKVETPTPRMRVTF
jgi:metallo-beta-lactamase family protein